MLLCPRCQRVNPAEAAFCHFDGAELRPANGKMTKQTRLPHEFVFPYGRRCNTYDEFVQGCQAEWEVARGLLKQGVFRQFLTSIGRTDLAQAAQQAESQPDPDIALDTFIGCLPAAAVAGPRLDLNPRRLNLGSLHVNETRLCRLAVLNQGKGLLHGTLAVAEGNGWLRLADSADNGQCVIKTANEQPFTLRIDTRGLSAPQKCSAKLTVITNGGIVEVPVRLDVAAHPFAHSPFQAVASPREMAERMRAQPKPAVPFLETGEIARWFASNGWSYPVEGPSAKGVAAVQQFFEAMGLSKPPPVELDAQEIVLHCDQGSAAPGQVILHSNAKKWVYARAESDVPWLRVISPNVSGPQQAVIAFEGEAIGLKPTRVHEGHIKIVANAGQTLAARVRLEVRRSRQTPVEPSNRPLLVGAAAGLLFRLFLAFPADLYARVWAATPGAGAPPGSFAGWREAPLGDLAFVKHFVLATWWLGALVGALLLRKRGTGKGDIVCGVITGATVGLVGSATFAFLWPGLDFLPRYLWRTIGSGIGPNIDGPAWLWTVVWLALATFTWAILGALLGLLLGQAGRPGSRLLGRAQQLLYATFRLIRLDRAAALFAPQ